MSAAAGGGEPVLLPMGVQLLDAVMAIEVRAYPFPWSRGNFVDSIAAGYLTRCLVSPEGELLGYLVAMAGFREWHLLNVTVSPEHQVRGLARQLMQALREHAETEGADCLWLEVRPSNHRARALYARLGYAQVGVRRDYYPDAGGRREDALVLCLELQPGAAG
jgi:ribosomal-protein-alanine N-acetyltransferase